MTNIIDSIIDYTLRSKYCALNKLGNRLYVNRQMSVNREEFVIEGYTSASKMQGILMEMKLLLNGRYAGNKEYLFERMNHLIDCAFKSHASKKKPTFIVNKKAVKELKKPVKQVRCKKTGRFIAKKKKK